MPNDSFMKVRLVGFMSLLSLATNCLSTIISAEKTLKNGLQATKTTKFDQKGNFVPTIQHVLRSSRTSSLQKSSF